MSDAPASNASESGKPGAKGRSDRPTGTTTQSTNDWAPIDLDEYSRLRERVLVTWEAWNEQPSNSTRVKAHVDATIAYAGLAHVEFSRFVTAALRRGLDRKTALDLWENDW